MDRRPLITELHSNVVSSNWTDILSHFCQKDAAEDRRFAMQVNMLRGEMADVCEKRRNLVDELRSVRGIIAPGKAIVFLKDTLSKDDDEMAQLRKLERQMELRALKKELFIQKLVRNHREFAIRMNRLVGEMNEACQDRVAFVRELESVAGVTVTAKTAVFFKKMMDKEGSREWQLRDLGKEAKERAREIELFVQKLMRDSSS
ncbi:hypothetical protein Tco_0256513 [Tanacetum coccineum]